MKLVLILLLGLMLVLIVTPAYAQTPLPPAPVTVTDDQVNDVARTLYCPVCENISLDVCPTQACEQWRSVIRQKLGEGWNKEQIEEYFALQYGDRVLAEPPRSGWNLLIYILPVVALALGAWVVYRILKPRRVVAAPASAEDELPEDPYLRRMEADHRKRMKQDEQRPNHQA